MKLLTFAIPSYNSQDYMEHCIESLLPGGEDVEILIVDDGSKDSTAEIADSYEKKLEILNNLHATITDSMIDTMAVSLDIEVKDGDIEQRYQEVLNCLLTMERFECNRLR